MAGFGDRLTAAVAARGPLCPGIDPHPELLRAWGLDADADGLRRFCDICVTAFADFAIVKPQVAFFEAYGAAGFAVLEQNLWRAILANIGMRLARPGYDAGILAGGRHQAGLAARAILGLHFARLERRL